MLNYLKKILKLFIEIQKAKKYLFSDEYYNDINVIPLYNWWKCSEGDYRYLWKRHRNYVPFYFKRIFDDMYFQLDYIDLTELRKITEANYYQNKYLATKDIKFKRKADTKFAELQQLKKTERSKQRLNDLVKFVQNALQLNWQIDTTKISAGYFMSLYNDALKSIENGYN